MNKLGIYFTAALLGIYSNSLLHMDGANIRKWIDKILSFENDWFKLLHIPQIKQTSSNNTHDLLTNSNSNEEEVQLGWDSFIRGWIHATASIVFFFISL